MIGVRIAPVLAALIVSGSVLAAPADETAEDEVPSTPERFEALVSSFETKVREMRENSKFDEVLLAEAEALVEVAKELFQEEDLETSIPLLEEAIALVESPTPQP